MKKIRSGRSLRSFSSSTFSVFSGGLNESTSSNSSNELELSTGVISHTGNHEKIERKVEKKGEKKFKKNKITKNDFCNKTAEFRMWLTETKQLTLEDLTSSQSKEHFKKFVKKWNSKKLEQKYYLGVESLWNMASPGAYTRPTENNQPLSTPEGQCTPKMTGCTPLYDKAGFSTFGKQAGRRLLEKLAQSHVEENTAKVGSSSHYYDLPSPPPECKVPASPERLPDNLKKALMRRDSKHSYLDLAVPTVECTNDEPVRFRNRPQSAYSSVRRRSRICEKQKYKLHIVSPPRVHIDLDTAVPSPEKGLCNEIDMYTEIPDDTDAGNYVMLQDNTARNRVVTGNQTKSSCEVVQQDAPPRSAMLRPDHVHVSKERESRRNEVAHTSVTKISMPVATNSEQYSADDLEMLPPPPPPLASEYENAGILCNVSANQIHKSGPSKLKPKPPLPTRHPSTRTSKPQSTNQYENYSAEIATSQTSISKKLKPDVPKRTCTLKKSGNNTVSEVDVKEESHYQNYVVDLQKENISKKQIVCEKKFKPALPPHKPKLKKSELVKPKPENHYLNVSADIQQNQQSKKTPKDTELICGNVQQHSIENPQLKKDNADVIYANQTVLTPGKTRKRRSTEPLENSPDATIYAKAMHTTHSGLYLSPSKSVFV